MPKPCSLEEASLSEEEVEAALPKPCSVEEAPLSLTTKKLMAEVLPPRWLHRCHQLLLQKKPAALPARGQRAKGAFLLEDAMAAALAKDEQSRNGQQMGDNPSSLSQNR